MDTPLGSHRNGCQLNPGDTQKSLDGMYLTNIAHRRLVQAVSTANRFLRDGMFAEGPESFWRREDQFVAEAASRARQRLDS
jgi:hypothetical protein